MKKYLILKMLILAFVVFMASVKVYSQQEPSLPYEKQYLHHEVHSDGYLPNAYNNTLVSPPFRSYTGGSKSSTIVTVQVNIDFAGQNVVGDAANEPSLAISPLNPDQIVIGWRQFDNISSNFRQAGWAFSNNAGQSWIHTGVIDPGIFRSDPVLDCDPDGNFFYNSLTYDSVDSLFYCRVYKSINGGVSWNAGVDAFGGDKQWMCIDHSTGPGRGNIYSFWTQYWSSCFPGYFTRSEDVGNSFEPCTDFYGSPYWGTMAVGNNGELYIGGQGQFDNPIVIRSDNAQLSGSTISWGFPVEVYLDGYLNYGTAVNPGGLLGQASIAVDRSGGAGEGNVYLLASVTRYSPDEGDVMFARSLDGGATWSSPARINDDVAVSNTQWFGTMSVAPNGRIDAIWLDTRDGAPGSDISALYYSWSMDQGDTWSVNEKLSPTFNPHVGYPNQNKMGDYFDMESDINGAHLAWSATLNGEEDVYYSYIVPQTGAGTEETADRSVISIYPNPTEGVFQISGAGDCNKIEVRNLTGTIVFSEDYPKKMNQMDISSLPSGIYFIVVYRSNEIPVVKKLIKC